MASNSNLGSTGLIQQGGQIMGANEVDDRTGFQKLEQIKGLFISQKSQSMECITGCEKPN
jgi:hypothetical protein